MSPWSWLALGAVALALIMTFATLAVSLAIAARERRTRYHPETLARAYHQTFLDPHGKPWEDLDPADRALETERMRIALQKGTTRP